MSIPGSKSHTIRALLLSAMADGTSRISSALDSEDTASCMSILQRLGVECEPAPADGGLAITVRSSGGFDAPEDVLDCGNSGTSLYLALGLTALHDFRATFTGDETLQRRSAGPLLAALEQLGATVDREGDCGGDETSDCVPFSVHGPITGGELTLESPVSQFLSSLLLAAPFTNAGVDIRVPLLNEKPYVGITLSWLDRLGITYEREAWSRFTVPGGQSIRGLDIQVPGDFSSATFFAVAAAMTGSPVEINGLDLTDSQGDKEVLSVLETLGASVTRPQARGGAILVDGPSGGLRGGSVDLNAMPDALPALAILGTTGNEPLELANVPQARQKETDRIAAMTAIINELGGSATELPDGMIVQPGRLSGGAVDSLGDHRIAMAMAIAGLVADGPVTVENAEVASVTFPAFYERLSACGATMETSE